MPEGLLEQTENSTPMMDVYSPPTAQNPQGTKGKVPFAQWGDYQKQGFKPAVRVTSPSGTGGWLPSDKVGDYVKTKNFKLGPPEQQKLTPAPVSDPAKDKSLTGMMGNGMPSQEDLNPTAEQHPVVASALNRAGRIVKGMAETFGKPPETTTEKASLIAGPVGPIITRQVGGQVDAEKQLAPQLKAQARIAAASHAGQNPIRASIPTLEDARAVTTGLSMINPFASGSVANVNQLQDQGKPDQAVGEGITDALALSSGLKGPSKVAGNVATDALATIKDAVPTIARPTAENSIVMRGIKNIKTAINPVGNMTAGELATKAVRPRNSKTNFPAELETALPDTKRALQNAGVDPGTATLHDTADGIAQAKKDVWAEYQQNHSGPAGELQIDTTPIADAMLSKITPRMRTQQPGLVKQIEANAAEYHGKSMAAQDLEQRVGEANNETRGIEAKYLTDKNAAKLDPSNAALFAERDTARQLLLNKLDEATGPGATQLRQRYGNLNSFQDVVSRRIPVADRAAPMGLPQILAKMYGPGKIVGGLAQVATGIGAGHGIANIIEGGASMIGAKNARLMNDPDALIQHAFDKTEATPAARPYVAPPTPAIRGLLNSAPIELPGNIDPIEEVGPISQDAARGIPGRIPAGQPGAGQMKRTFTSSSTYVRPPIQEGGEVIPPQSPIQINPNARSWGRPTPESIAPIARPGQQNTVPTDLSQYRTNAVKSFGGEQGATAAYTDEGLRAHAGIPPNVSLRDLEAAGAIKHNTDGTWQFAEQQGAQPAPATQQGAPERRQATGSDLRAILDEAKAKMSPEENTSAIFSDEKTNLPNRKAFNAAQEALARSYPHVGFADIDGFKDVNTQLGEPTVDKTVFPAIGEAMRNAAAKENGAVHVFHVHGDEFQFLGSDPDAISRVVDSVNKELAGAKFTVKNADGSISEVKGVGFSHGTGETLEAASAAEQLNKQARKAAGLRTGARDAP